RRNPLGWLLTSHDAGDCCRNLVQGQAVVWVHLLQGASWHRRHQRIIGVLDDGDSPGVFDHRQARTAVRQKSCEDHSDGTLAIKIGDSTKKRINGRAMTVVLGTTYDSNSIASFDDHVVVRRSNIDVAMFYGRAILRLYCIPERRAI